jgi:hypothetical protein
VQLDVFSVDPALLEDWRPPARSAYAGMHGSRHGLRAPEGTPPPLNEARA